MGIRLALTSALLLLLIAMPAETRADFGRLSPAPGPPGLLPARDPSELCEQAIADGARRSGVPEAVLHAISLTETGRRVDGRLRPWPWAINREGQGYWFRNRDEALAFARESAAAGRRSFDVSCFQINYLWHGANFPSLESMFDLDTAADYAAGLLKQLHAETGDWSVAAGAYHSRTAELASRYRARFDQMLALVTGAPPLATRLPPPAAVAEVEVPRVNLVRKTRGPLIIRIARSDQPPAQSATGRMAGLDVRRLEKVVGGAGRAATVKPAEAPPGWTASAGRQSAAETAVRRGEDRLD